MTKNIIGFTGINGFKWPYKFDELVCTAVKRKFSFEEVFVEMSEDCINFNISAPYSDFESLSVELNNLILDLYFEPYEYLLSVYYADPENKHREIWDTFKAIKHCSDFYGEKDTFSSNLEIYLPPNVVTLIGNKIKPINFEIRLDSIFS